MIFNFALLIQRLFPYFSYFLSKKTLDSEPAFTIFCEKSNVNNNIPITAKAMIPETEIREKKQGNHLH